MRKHEVRRKLSIFKSCNLLNKIFIFFTNSNNSFLKKGIVYHILLEVQPKIIRSNMINLATMMASREEPLRTLYLWRRCYLGLRNNNLLTLINKWCNNHHPLFRAWLHIRRIKYKITIIHKTKTRFIMSMLLIYQQLIKCITREFIQMHFRKMKFIFKLFIIFK